MAQISDSSENRQPSINDGNSASHDQTHQHPHPRETANSKLDEHQKQGLSGGTWIAVILGALVLIMLVIFILQNNVPADFTYLSWNFTLPLGVAMLFAAIAGMLVMGLFGSVKLFKVSRRVRKLEKDREEIKRTLH